MDVVAVDAVLALRPLGVFVFVLQPRHVHGRSVWQPFAGLALEHGGVAGIPGVQGKNPIHGLLQRSEGIVSIGSFRGLGAVARVNGAVGIEEHGGPTEVLVELEE